VYVAVLQAEGRKFGLVVDRVLNTEEVVVKALSSRFKEIGMYAGPPARRRPGRLDTPRYRWGRTPSAGCST
jgi:hypothetical protein